MSENNAGNPIFVLGQEYLFDFTQLLSRKLEKFLLEKWGEDWFQECVIKDFNVSVESMNDLSFLMRQILDLNNHNFRVAMAMSFFGKMQMEKPHLTALEMIRKSRNFWAHPNRLIKLHDLNKLAFNIRALIPASDPLSEKCARLLSTEERDDYLSVIASMTEINRIYRNTIEYKTEMAKSLSEFNSHIKELGKDREFDPIYTAQNHMLRNLWVNYLLMQPMYYALQLDCLIEKRDTRTGFKTFSDKILLEIQRSLDIGGGLRLASEYADTLKSELGNANCDCEFCQTIAGSGPVLFREDFQKKVDDLHVATHEGKDLSVFFDDQDFGGHRPPYYWFLIVMCVAKGGISTEEVIKWNFDVLNPSLEMGSEAFENHDVFIATIKLLAIRNGVPPSVVDKWDLAE
jgi:hypothetical protein